MFCVARLAAETAFLTMTHSASGAMTTLGRFKTAAVGCLNALAV